MATVAKSYTREAASAIVKAIPGAVLSGIVPDPAHLDDGGYHVSIEDLRRHGNAGDYSNARKLDKAPPVTADGRRNACAIDVSLGRAQMARLYTNVERVWVNRATDTRTKYINAINVWSGRAGLAPVRFNFQTGTRTNANRSHEWHGHADWVRVYVDEQFNHDSALRAARAMVSIWLGQPHDGWLRQEKLGPYAPKPPAPIRPPAPTAPEDDDMTSMITQSHPLPVQYAYDPNGKPLPDAGGMLTIGLPPAGHPDHKWGRDYFRPYVGIAADHVPAGTRLRFAVNDGAKWHTQIVDLDPAQHGRRNITMPALPATGTPQGAWVIVVGRVEPAPPEGPANEDDLPQPGGTIAIITEIVRRYA